MLKRTSNVVWTGSLTKGAGTITTLSGALKELPYSVNSRFVAEDGRAGTNPEELLAATHAACFTMAFAAQLTQAGHEPTELATQATVSMDKVNDQWTITQIHLETTGKVPGVDAAKFGELADNAKKGCPISRALAATPISMTAKLLS
jgi:osmotically inducible protein OsmC